MPLSTTLRQLRLKKGQSLQEVADAIGVSKTHIWELEKGRSKNPSVELLTKLADHFRVTIRSLIDEDMDAEIVDEELLRMFRQVGQLSEDDRRTLDDMIQSFLRRRKEQDDAN